MSTHKPSYWQLLQDPRWQKKRLDILNRAEFKCQCCGDATKTLDIHHRYYSKGLKPWEYPDLSLVAVCKEDHEILAEYEQSLIEAIDPRDIINIAELATAILKLRQCGIGIKKIVDFAGQLATECMGEKV